MNLSMNFSNTIQLTPCKRCGGTQASYGGYDRTCLCVFWPKVNNQTETSEPLTFNCGVCGTFIAEGHLDNETEGKHWAECPNRALPKGIKKVYWDDQLKVEILKV